MGIFTLSWPSLFVDVSIHAKKRTPSPDHTKGITIANAKYSSEDAATLVQYTIAIVEYTRRCGPLKASIERMHELQREIEENDRLQREKEKEVCICPYSWELWNPVFLWA